MLRCTCTVVRPHKKALTLKQCFGFGSALVPYSAASWIRIRVQNMDPDLGGYKQRQEFTVNAKFTY